MGFGLLFVGYVSLLFFKVLPPAMLAGQCLCAYALKKLTVYEKSFRAPYILSVALAVYFALYTALWGAYMARLTDIVTDKVFIIVDDIVYKALFAVWHFLLFAALERICRTVGYDKGVGRARLARVFLVMAYAVWGLRLIVGHFTKATYLPLAELVFLLGVIGFTAAYIYACYMRIATPAILEEEKKRLLEYERRYGFRTPKATTKQNKSNGK